MILIDLAAYAHDTKAQMEEMLTMNNYYHPREHDHGDDAHFEHADHSDHVGHHSDASFAHDQHPMDVSNYEGQLAATDHESEEAAEEPNAGQGPSDAEYPDSDRGLYQVLLAVERGELSAEDAARKLEALEDASSPEESEELI